MARTRRSWKTNVCFDFYGHGYFLEDGTEQENRFIGNLGVMARKPEDEGLALLETDFRSGSASNGPAVFWITHLNNSYSGNVAAGSEGTGFWFSQQSPSQPLKLFENNLAHSSRQGLSTCFNSSGPAGILMQPAGKLLQSFMSNQNEQGVWPCAYVQGGGRPQFDDMVVANSANGMQAPNPVEFTNSLFVGLSANGSDLWEPDSNWRGIQVYDQGFMFDTVHFVNFDRPAMTAFYPGAGAHKLSSNRVSNVTRDNAPHIFLDPNDHSHPGATPGFYGDIVHDLDGSLLGEPLAIVSDHHLMYDDNCRQPTNLEIAGYACPYRYAHFRSEFGAAAEPVEATVMRSDGRHETSEHIPNRYITEIIVDGPYFYSWRYTQGLKHKRLDLDLREAFPGDTAVYEILDVPSTVTIDTPGWSQAADVDDLISGPGHRWFWRDQSLFLKLLASGNDWSAKDEVRICPQGNCSVNPPAGALPSVTVDTPADGDRIPSATSFPVSATIVDPDGGTIQSAKVFLGTQPINVLPTVSGDTWNWSIPRQLDGAYPLKVVAISSNGKSFTALQQLFVGDAIPRVEITSIDMDQTFDADRPLVLDYDLSHWPLTGAAGKHLRLYVNNVDMLGPITAPSPIQVTGLPQGRQDIKLALADGSTVLAVHDVVRAYGMSGLMIADFEDGPDWRGSLGGSDIGTSEIKFAWRTADPVASRLDGEDDINWFDLVDDQNAVNGTAVYALALDPPQNWTATGMSRLQVKSDAGIGYDLWLIDATQGATLLGSGGSPSTLFTLPAPALMDEVVRIELRYDESTLPAAPQAAREHLRHIRLVP